MTLVAYVGAALAFAGSALAARANDAWSIAAAASLVALATVLGLVVLLAEGGL